MNARSVTGVLRPCSAPVWLMAGRPTDAVGDVHADRRQHPQRRTARQARTDQFLVGQLEICKRDMPRLKALHESLADQRFTVIGVAMSYDPPPAVFDAVEKLQPGYPIALDTRGEIGKAFGDVRVTPTTFLIDPQGNIRYSARGPLDETRIRATLTTF